MPNSSPSKESIDQQIDRYIDGNLDEKEVEQLWSVLIQNKEYYDYLQTSANLKEVKDPDAKSRDIYTNKWIYAAAAVIVTLIVTVVVFQLQNNTQSSIDPVAAIELPFQRSVDPVQQLSDHRKTIRKATLWYYKDHFDKAVSLLKNELVSVKNPNWAAELNTTLGIFYYNDHKYVKAVNFFKTAASYKGLIDPLKLEKAYWYLGNTWYQLKKYEKAERMMHKVIKIDGAYSRVAKRYLEAMAEVKKE